MRAYWKLREDSGYAVAVSYRDHVEYDTGVPV